MACLTHALSSVSATTSANASVVSSESGLILGIDPSPALISSRKAFSASEPSLIENLSLGYGHPCCYRPLRRLPGINLFLLNGRAEGTWHPSWCVCKDGPLDWSLNVNPSTDAGVVLGLLRTSKA